jgi:uncharacterized membrane protein YkvA (DUF1232 family)
MLRRLKMIVFFNKMRKLALNMYKDRKQTGELVTNANEKVSKNDVKDVLAGLYDKVKALIRLVDHYRKGDYKDISKQAIVLIIAGLLYFISPIDAVPDFIAGLGLIDDVAILTYVMKKLNDEIEGYMEWEEQQKVDTL